MLTSLKFRLYPTALQTRMMHETLETCRRLYNSMLADRIENGRDFYEQKRMLVELKTKDKHLRSVHSQVLQDVVLRLDKAYQAFFVGLSRSPKFKRSGRYKSFTYPQSGFKLEGNKIRLSTIGNVRLRLHREVTEAIKRVTVVREIDQWFVILLMQAVPITVRSGGGAIGVDLGISNLMALSNGALIASPGFLKRSKRLIEGLNKEVSAKKRGSKNREKAKMSLAKAWRKVRRQREDFAHKLSDRSHEALQTHRVRRPQNQKYGEEPQSGIGNNGFRRGVSLCQLTAYKAEGAGRTNDTSSNPKGHRRNALDAETRFPRSYRKEFTTARDAGWSWTGM